jgi:23S rRNA pseudouridine1911/1915/1917 synthase
VSQVSDRVYSFSYSGEHSQRLDKFLVSCFPDFSRSRLQGLIRDGFVRVDGVPAAKTGQELVPGMAVEVRVPPPEPVDLEPEHIPLEILFENQDLLVINKPAGMVVHPAVGHTRGTLVNAALAHAPDMEGVGGEIRPGIVHRLDKDTSGLILIAKNERAHRMLQDQFRLRQVKKIYLALVDGKPPTPEGRIEAPIGRDPKDRKRMAVVPESKGRQAVSEYRTLKSYPLHTLLEVHPLTGRTHQIRLHLAFLGCPVVGDTIYGRKKASLPIDRHFLHAYQLVIQLPGKTEPQSFQAPLPGELEEALHTLERLTKTN